MPNIDEICLSSSTTTTTRERGKEKEEKCAFGISRQVP